MNHQNQIPEPDAQLEVIDSNSTSTSTVDEFIRELEAKEKALHITSDMTIEIEESEFDSFAISEIGVEESVPAPETFAAEPKPAVHGAGAKTRIYELEQEIEKLNERIVGLRADRNDIQEKSDQRLKDFQNFKYRMDRERRGSFIDQISNLASQMLPVMDNLDRALRSVENLDRKKSDDFQQFFDGIVLVNHQVNEVFSEMGVEPIKTVGETFDPNFHEAVSVEDRDDMPPNSIIEEMLRGYRIGNRVIRHSMVKVTTAPKPARSEPVDLNPPDDPPGEETNESESTESIPQSKDDPPKDA